jgi:hypothetical protein
MAKLEGVDGSWYEQPDILSKYKRRDEQLEEICYSHYGKIIRSGGKLKHTESNGGLDAKKYKVDDSDDEYDSDDEDPNTKFHNIITHHRGHGKEIPQYPKLRNSLPR